MRLADLMLADSDLCLLLDVVENGEVANLLPSSPPGTGVETLPAGGPSPLLPAGSAQLPRGSGRRVPLHPVGPAASQEETR